MKRLMVFLIVFVALVICISCSRTVKDVDGNVYHTVQIGEQLWLKENLKTTHFADGSDIALSNNKSSTNIGYRYTPGNSEANVEEYGYLYNYAVVKDTRGVCPKGWHVPSEAEFEELLTFVKKTYAEEDEEYIGRYLTENDHGTNESGFSAMLAGSYYDKTAKSVEYMDIEGQYWSYDMSVLDMCQWLADVQPSSRRNAHSIRCVKDK